MTTNASFAQLKRSRENDLKKLTDELAKVNGGQDRSGEDNYWSPTVDKNGNGSAVIRFLPAPPNEDVPWIRFWDHGFQGPTGQWYIEKSLTTIDQDDPVGEINGALWNTGREEDKETARKQKRRLHFVSNIYVIKDPAKPENDGKVFKYKYGKKIFDKLNDKMNPAFEDEMPLNPFDLWEGANFRLRIRKVEGWQNYDKSDFDEKGPLFDDDSKLEEIWKSEFSLQEIIDPKNFKSYDELKRKVEKILSVSVNGTAPRREPEIPAPAASKERAPKKFEEEDDDTSFDADSGEDAMDFFKNLANDDDVPF